MQQLRALKIVLVFGELLLCLVLVFGTSKFSFNFFQLFHFVFFFRQRYPAETHFAASRGMRRKTKILSH